MQEARGPGWLKELQRIGPSNLGHPNIGRYVPRKLWNYLISLPGRTIQIQFYILIFSLYHVIHRVYNENYNANNATTASSKNTSAKNTSTAVNKDRGNTQYNPSTAASGLNNELESNFSWQWRNFPRTPSFFIHCRTFSTVYMSYVLLKNTVIQYLVNLIGINESAQCYLLGRFKIHPSVDTICATFYVAYHLSWRFISVFGYRDRPLAVSTWYFFVLDDQDIEHYYQIMNEQRIRSCNINKPLKEEMQAEIPRIRPKHHDSHSADQAPACLESHGAGNDNRLQMMHDIMSFRVDLAAHTIYKLRPNRTREASKNLHSYLAHVTACYLTLFIPLSVTVATALAWTVFDHQRYLREYQNCDPILEQLNRENRLADWWRYLARHQYIALFFDVIENVVLWLESALVLVSFLSYSIIMNYDLLVHWDCLHRKIVLLINLARNQKGEHLVLMSDSLSASSLSHLEDSNKHYEWDQAIYELQAEISDFVKQLSQSDMCMTDLLSYAITIWFSLFAFFTYSTIASGQVVALPIELSLVLVLVFVITTGVWYILLILHRRCLKTYPLICSLMALDQSERKSHFMEVIDYFVRRRTCYTVFRGYPMTTTTYLTIIGYTFSCFFVLGNIHKR